jgi:hypothetical protein
MKTARMKAIIGTGMAVGMLVATTHAFAETEWEKHHPRRDQVNDRLENQNARIKAGREQGTLTPQEAHQLHREDRQIRHQERHSARHHGGHITPAEQAKLNQEENAVSHQIYQEKHDGQ